MKRREFFALSGSGFALAASGSAQAGSADTGPTEELSATDFKVAGDGRTDDTDALQAALDALARSRRVKMLRIPPGDYVVTRPLRLDLRHKRIDGIWGISAYGARIRSRIDDGQDVLTVDSTHVVRYFLIEGLAIRGTGKEGHGLHLHCDGHRHYLYNAALRDVVVENCGGDGCRMIGNIFESQIINSYFRDNRGNGMTLGHGTDGGVLSALHVFGCVFGGNRKHGVVTIREANDISFTGCYFLLNGEYGLVASNGCVLLAHSGFENNHERAKSFDAGNAGMRINVFGTLIGCTAYSIHNQTHLVSGYVTNNLVLIGCTGSGGGRARRAQLASLDGAKGAEVTVIGSRGKIATRGGVVLTEIGRRGARAGFGSNWNSDDLVRLGDYRLWVDGDGELRIKQGTPTSDKDGRPVAETA